MEAKHFMCRPCRIPFNREDSLIQHWETSLAHKYDYCSLHKKILEGSNTAQAWSSHIQAEHFPCGNLCQEHFNTQEDRSRHGFEEHCGEYCPFCESYFAKLTDLERHMNSRHHWCPRCIREFHSKNSLKRHYRISLQHRYLYCVLCDEHFKDGARLVVHRIFLHEYLGTPSEYRGDHDASTEWTKWVDYFNFRFESGAKILEERWQPHNRSTKAQKSYWANFSDQDRRSYWEAFAKPRGPDKEAREKARNHQGKSECNERGQQTAFPQKCMGSEVPDHYATLNISRDLPQGEMEKVAKKRRVEVHPDKLARTGKVSPEDYARRLAEAKEVGYAADILSNAELRAKYDRQLCSAKNRQA